jgi:flagellar protein FlaI
VKDGLFVHIVSNEESQRDFHVTIEPDLTLHLAPLLERVEEELVEYAEEIGAQETDEAREQALLEAINDICTTDPREDSYRIFVTERELEGLTYHLRREKMGLGALHPILQDPHIEDISCSGVGPVFIEHKIFGSLESSVVFSSMDELDDFVVWLGEWIKKPVTVRNPIVDATLPDGSRINIVYGREIATRGSNFTIRRFSETPLSVPQLIEFGTFNYKMAAYLSLILEEGLNLFVVGATASGKTTTLNAITSFLLPEAKIVSIEDTPEVQVAHTNWVREVTRESGQGDKGEEVGMFKLLKAALRQRPDRIIVGEIRGAEGAIAFQAMQTGHGVMSTFHAASVEKLVQRLTGDPINIPKTYMDNLHVAIIQGAVRGPDNKRIRRILSINEILGYDPVSESFSFIEVSRWNSADDTFEFPGDMNSYLLEEVIAMKRGIPPRKRKAIYKELNKRARIFERVHKERNLTDFYDFFRLLSEAHKKGLL